MILSKIEAFMGHHWTFLGGDRCVFKVSITLLCFEVLKWLVEGESLRWSTYLAVPLVAVSHPVQDSALTAIVAQQVDKTVIRNALSPFSRIFSRIFVMRWASTSMQSTLPRLQSRPKDRHRGIAKWRVWESDCLNQERYNFLGTDRRGVPTCVYWCGALKKDKKASCGANQTPYFDKLTAIRMTICDYFATPQFAQLACFLRKDHCSPKAGFTQVTQVSVTRLGFVIVLDRARPSGLSNLFLELEDLKEHDCMHSVLHCFAPLHSLHLHPQALVTLVEQLNSKHAQYGPALNILNPAKQATISARAFFWEYSNIDDLKGLK